MNVGLRETEPFNVSYPGTKFLDRTSLTANIKSSTWTSHLMIQTGPDPCTRRRQSSAA